MTDNQDYALNSTHPYYMPQLHRLVRQRGLEVRHFTTPVASCCPARTAFLTGSSSGTDGAVANLTAAMDPKYDNLYSGFKMYKKCTIYYVLNNEEPDSLAGRGSSRQELQR
ncbi:hypothetical protein HYH02_010227 [Chlamydomonas schloesseri]|uniref:Sulfatase N-terminal domain-containing protein n=1 Tax=Chlamydomonas schloesseri TaxID=2026947 RepID=A0A835T8I6_9CHLO|nr:hypothetical protein HYH02_010227 [Chlamydomonas schloesseri]|eukprot:KAG2440648.1 hypothetical protein HYH02_010227 [Chlamydomonas schloesseri]